MNPFLSSNQQVNLSNGTANIFINQIEVGGSAQVPTMPLSDSSNAAASTAFVQNAISDVAGGNMSYSGTGDVGKHYRQESLDGKTAINSKLYEDENNFDFGANNLINVDNINCTQVSIGTTEYGNQTITDAIEINLNTPIVKSNSPSVIFSETTQLNTVPGKNLTVVSGGLLNLYGTNITANATNNINMNSADYVNINTGNMTISSNTILTNSALTAGSFIKTGGLNIQYLMANGSTLTASANSGNSNFYLYNSGTSQSPTPPNGYITYNNATQSNATIIYISHLTRDNVDIEVYFKQITTLTEVYIQDENVSSLYIQYNVTGNPTITTEAQIAIPVLVNGIPGTTGFTDGHNVFVSFFTNGLEVDTRLSNLETKTQYQGIVSGTTTFSSDITIEGVLQVNSSIITNGNICLMGSGNTNANNNASNVIFGNYNTSQTLRNIMFGVFNNCSGDHSYAFGYQNTCSANSSIAIGQNITNSTPNSVCLGDLAVAAIFPNSLVCDLGTSSAPYKDIYYTGELKRDFTSKLDLNYINSFYIGIQFQHGSGSLTLMSNSLWTALGSTSSAFPTYAITNNFTRQLCCGFWTFPTPANGQVCGYGSTNSTGIQVSTGFQWGLYAALGMADTGAELMASQNFWGLWNVATAIPLNQTTQLSVQRNMICFGSNTTDTNLCIYTGGVSSTVKQVDLGVNFPSNRGSGADPTNFYRLSFYWDGTKIYYKAINTTLNITVQGSFTPLSTDMPATTISLYPQCSRVMGTPNSTTGTRLKVQRFGIFY